MAEPSGNAHGELFQGMTPAEFLDSAIQRLRFKNSWSKEEVCKQLDIKPSELNKYLKGQQPPPETLLLIVKKELESLGGYERRGKIRMTEILDRLVQLERRVEKLEQRALPPQEEL